MNPKKRIALISVHGDPAIDTGKEEADGQNVYVRQVGESLAKQGWMVDMFTRKTAVDQPTIVQHHPNCRTIRLVAGEETFIPRDELFVYLPDFIKSFQTFQRENQIHYPIIHTNYWLSAWVGMKLRKYQPDLKQVHTYHSLGAIQYQSVRDIPSIVSTRLAIEQACLETSNCIIATSPQEEEHMRQFLSKKGNIEIIPCGADIHRFGSVSRSQARLRLGIPKSSLVILSVGRFDRRKGIDTLVRAVHQSILNGIADIRLILVGGSPPGQNDGNERERIEKMVDELNLRDITTFAGQINHDVLPYYYAAANVCAILSHDEPFGLVAVEAMAAGVPVVAAAVGGLKYIVVPEQTGLLCPPKDDGAFAYAIDRILCRPIWQTELSQAARKRVETLFSWDGVARQLNDLYLSLLKTPVPVKPTVPIDPNPSIKPPVLVPA